jgi:RimJ/RimL family protein N-acetyltransferase
VRGNFPSDDAASKLIWLALRNINDDWSLASHDLKAAMSHFAILYHDRFAWGAVVGELPDPPGVGIGRYAKYQAPRDGAVSADLAITVLDEWHSQGVGSALLDALTVTAHFNGVERFDTIVMAENEPMLAVFRRLGAEISKPDMGVVDVYLDVAPRAEALADHPLARLLAVGVDLDPRV